MENDSTELSHTEARGDTFWISLSVSGYRLPLELVCNLSGLSERDVPIHEGQFSGEGGSCQWFAATYNSWGMRGTGWWRGSGQGTRSGFCSKDNCMLIEGRGYILSVFIFPIPSSFNHPFKNYLLCDIFLPSTTTGTQETSVSETKIIASWHLCSTGREIISK